MTSTRVSGAVAALRICSSVATIIFVAFAVGAAVRPDQQYRSLILGVFVLSALICGVISRVSHHVTPERAEWLLLVLCLVPTVDVLLGMAILRDVGLTDFLYLVLLLFGLLTMRWQSLVALSAGTVLAWFGVASWVGVAQPLVFHDLVQLVLRCAVAFAVFRIRDRLDGELQRTGSELDDQIHEVALVRDQRERDLRRYRTLFDDGPAGTMLMDLDGTVIDVNAAMLELLDRPRDHVVGRGFREFSHAEERRRSRDQESVAALAQSRTALSLRLLRSDGELRSTTISMSPVQGPDGESWVLAHVTDDTDRRRMEQDLIRSRDGMRAVADIASAAQRNTDPRPVALAHLQRLGRASLVLLAEPRDERTLVFTQSSQPEMLGAEVDLSEQSGTVHTWRTGESLFVADAGTSPLVNRRLLEIAGVTSVMLQPVGIHGNMQGVLAIGWDERVTDVSDLDRDAVRTIAAELSAALQAESLRAQLERRTMVDALTGLLNRRGWDQETEQLAAEAVRGERPVVLAVADLDHFKQFNDEFGHLEGDMLLSEFGVNAHNAVRERDVVARWGGEEFAIALADCDVDDAVAVLERIRTGVPHERTCSIGYAVYDPRETVEECMRRVDQALYRAKANGRDRIEYSHYRERAHDDPTPITEGSARGVVGRS